MAAQVPAINSMKFMPRNEETIEATAPEAARKLSLDHDHHAGLPQRVYGLAARTIRGITFEEYRYWAKEERNLEREENRQYVERRGPATIMSTIKGRFSKGIHHENAQREAAERELAEKNGDGTLTPIPPPQGATNEEWRVAARALRTASWGTVFFVMTTDILGWSSTPFVFSSVGFAPGVVLYTLFGLAAGLSGVFIWRTFLGLDSSRYPMLSFGDPFLRIYGPKTRHFINILQSIQQFLSVAVLVLGQGQVLYQITNYKLCFAACMVIIMVVGMISGSIRSLQRLSWMCNLSVWLNVVSFVIIIVAAAKYGPDKTVAIAGTNLVDRGPVKTFVGPPPITFQQGSATSQFAAQFSGVDQMVYSYSGAILFVAFLAEMRHPLDFWKGMIVAQAFIAGVYIIFGAVVYNFYGQYSYNVVSQVVKPFYLQTVGNVFGLITGFIAIFLYFNIGMKTVYLEIGQELLNFPPIITKKGKLLWYALGPVYWILALVLAASAPNLFGISNFVGGMFSLNFTYSIPGLMYVGYKVQCGAKLPGEGFDPATGITTRLDSGMKRWVRGYKKHFVICTLSLLFSMAGLASAGMGTWSAVIGLQQFFADHPAATSWGCVIS
ncbi:hypothetical protein R9X50_00590300 [Acrodontium crateriforme]|uniref:Amino acid transporter transmembrane domain-containing protein n=1 Tax=Acrodontium crateriforme TaxID=150365 RepID=A0AAQ3R9H6_9PEZI|nr:hypothetical protein R9X50_00590300 [Acrodontium crateriforme]